MRSRFAGGGRNGIGQAEAIMDNVGAHFGLTIFWKFIDEDLYYSKEWNDGLKLGIVVLNIYHFFIRKWCFPKCFENLMNSFKSRHLTKVTYKETKLLIELMVLGILIGICLVPGGHFQF